MTSNVQYVIQSGISYSASHIHFLFFFSFSGGLREILAFDCEYILLCPVDAWRLILSQVEIGDVFTCKRSLGVALNGLVAVGKWRARMVLVVCQGL